MKLTRLILATLGLFSLTAPLLQAAPPTKPAELAAATAELLKSRCAECHNAEDADGDFGLAEDLAALAASTFVSADAPPKSVLYAYIEDNSCPRTTKADKTAGRGKQPLSADDKALLLAWLRDGTPGLDGKPISAKPAAAPAAPVVKTAPVTGADVATSVPQAPKEEVKPAAEAKRVIVTEAQVIAGAVADLLALPPQERAGTRYLSLHALHNNLEKITAADLATAQAGIRKLLNSLSSVPEIATFPAVGPEKVLYRVRLRDIGKDWQALWDEITGTYPYAVGGDGLRSAAASAQCRVPVVRAEWFASVVTRPPFYERILNIPGTATELEKRLGVDVNHNLQQGEAARAAFSKSAISRQNRMVERHKLGAYPGAYWKSYDFKKQGGRGNLRQFPLGPENARLAGGELAFQHDGGEIIYNLPNGLQAYMLVNGKDVRLDEAAPQDVVEDHERTTGRTQIFNGLSCMACHTHGMKSVPTDDVRAGAGSFSGAATTLIRQLYVEPAQMETLVKADAKLFQEAMAKASVPLDGPEPVSALVALFEKDVSYAQAAAELGLSLEELKKRIAEFEPKFFNDRLALEKRGIPREQFADSFTRLAEALGFGDVLAAQAAPAAFQQIAAKPDLTAQEQRRRNDPLLVELTTDKATYKNGERLFPTVRATRDCHLRLFYQNNAGEVYPVFPNKFQKDDRILGGQAVKVGAEGGGFKFIVRTSQPGVERLAAVVSDTPFASDAALKAFFEQNPDKTIAKSVGEDLEEVIGKDLDVEAEAAAPNAARDANISKVTLQVLP